MRREEGKGAVSRRMARVVRKISAGVRGVRGRSWVRWRVRVGSAQAGAERGWLVTGKGGRASRVEGSVALKVGAKGEMGGVVGRVTLWGMGVDVGGAFGGGTGARLRMKHLPTSLPS